jgi:hypothetical protein
MVAGADLVRAAALAWTQALAALQRLRGGVLVEPVEAGAELVGGVRVEPTEDGPCPPPRLPGRVGVAGGAVRLAELGEDAGLTVAVVELPEQPEGLAVAVEGLGSVAEVLVGVAKA